jgi:hypothetical protein
MYLYAIISYPIYSLIESDDQDEEENDEKERENKAGHSQRAKGSVICTAY